LKRARGCWRFCRRRRCFVGPDAAEQIAGVGQLFVDGFETLAERELAAFEHGEQVARGNDVECELLAAAGMCRRILGCRLLCVEVVSVGGFERKRQALLGLQLDRAFASSRIDCTGVERIEFVERRLTLRLLS